MNDRNFYDAMREIDGGGWELTEPDDGSYEAELATDEARYDALASNLSFLCMKAAEDCERDTNAVAKKFYGQEAKKPFLLATDSKASMNSLAVAAAAVRKLNQQ